MKILNVVDEREVLGKNFRIYGDFDNPLFLAKDLAKWLDYNKDKVGQMLSNVDSEEKFISPIYYSGQVRDMWFLTEDGLYEVLMQSRKPIAKTFKKKVKEILKEIRKTGGYIPANENDSEMDILAKALIIAQNKISQKEELLKIKDKNILAQKEIIKEYKPKVEAYDSFIDSDGLIKVSTIAQDYGMSAIELNKLLYKLGIQYKNGDQWFLYAKYKDMGYVKSTYKEIPHRNGTISIKATTKWTPKGRAFIDEILKGIGISSVFINKSYQQIAF